MSYFVDLKYGTNTMDVCWFLEDAPICSWGFQDKTKMWFRFEADAIAVKLRYGRL